MRHVPLISRSGVSIFRRIFPLLLALGFSARAVAGTELVRFEDSRVSMACTYTIVLYGKDPKQLPLICNAALDEVDRIDEMMSNYKPESPLSVINRDAGKGPVRVEPELFHFLERCVGYSQESDGAFDVTVGPLMKAWGFFRNEGRIPWTVELWNVMRRVGYQYLKLNAADRTVQFGKDGMEIDLGGIAKGYAVDRVVELLKEDKIENAFISAGGSTLYALGTPPDRPGWEVKLRDPLSPHDPNKSAMTVTLKNQCLSVSGNYEKFFVVRGVTYSHIMNPKTGRPVDNMLSVAVLTNNGTDGDALDDSFYVLGVEKSRALLEKYPGTEAFFFLPAGEKQWRMDRLSRATATP
ncbi:MAG: FAD:protein FMN transferase [Terriglobia bacterium]